MTIYSHSRRQSVTVESIVEQILATWHPSNLEFVLTNVYDFGLIEREIRNQFHLWDTDHPLTEHWHRYPEAREIINGVDCSPDHPDAVAAAIHSLLKERL
jgi:hypothetical protein